MKQGTLLALILGGLCWTELAAGAQFAIRDGTVVAREGNRVLWQNTHDRGKHFRAADKPGYSVGPVQANGSLYYAVGVTLFEVDPASGVVRRRILLPAPCAALAPERDAVLLELRSHEANGEWSRRYRVGANGNDIPFFPPGSVQGARMARTDAQGVLRAIVEADPRAPKLQPQDSWRTEPGFKPYLEAAVQQLSRLERWDPTNPWYRYWRGAYLKTLGREAEAAAAFRSALALSPAYDFELIGLASVLDEFSPELASSAFQRGMRFLVQHGYEPEMNATVLSVVTYLGRSEPLDPQQHLDRLNRRGERLWAFAPYAEFTAWMYQGLASANRKAGHAGAAATWEARAAASAPYGILFAGRSASWAGIGLNGIAAAMVALFLALVVKALRSGPDPRTARGLARWNMFAGWTRGEILGFLLVHILLVVALVTVVRGVSAIARSAAAPLGAVSGNFGHPDGIEYFATLQGTPAGDFVYALALHKGGELDRAASIYARLRSPRAVNNLGVILHARGQADEARKLFEAARSADATLAEAAYNLDQPTTSARVQRARELGVAGPLQAMPTPQMWSQALAGPLQLWSLPGQALGVASLPSDQASRGERAASMVVGAVFTLLYLGVGALAILALLGIMPAGAPAPRSRRTLAGWALGFVVPGTARQLGALGPPLLTLCAFSYFVHYALGLSEGLATDIIGAIAIPDIANYHGIAEPAYTPLERLVRATRNLFWMLWIGNLVAVILLERLSPDPAGRLFRPRAAVPA
jgi:tetratricopeptide (TPR) repeat protein